MEPNLPQDDRSVEAEGAPSSRFREVLRALRIHQYAKNLLLFVPILMAHEYGNVDKLLSLLLGFVAFCACASGAYLLNDYIDLEADRRHPSKSKRPFASGGLALENAPLLIPSLFGLGLLLSYVESPAFLLTLVIYVGISTLYSLYLKRFPLVDSITLAGLYMLRLFAGGVLAQVEVSEWLLAFALFFFFGLALAKRYAELHRVSIEQRAESEIKQIRVDGRGYYASDLTPIGLLGIASGYNSVAILTLYINSEKMQEFYSRPDVLWFICPLLLFWIGRIWLFAFRGALHEDPIVFALQDRTSYVVAILTFCSILLAR